MTVKSTSITATTPMTSFARRDNVGTGTGGRMATVGLLSSTTYEAGSTETRPREHGDGIQAPPETGGPGHGPFPQLLPTAAGSRPRPQADHGVLTEPSAGGRRPAGAQVCERTEGVVQGGDLGHRQPRLRVLHGLGAV